MSIRRNIVHLFLPILLLLSSISCKKDRTVAIPIFKAVSHSSIFPSNSRIQSQLLLLLEGDNVINTEVLISKFNQSDFLQSLKKLVLHLKFVQKKMYYLSKIEKNYGHAATILNSLKITDYKSLSKTTKIIESCPLLVKNAKLNQKIQHSALPTNIKNEASKMPKTLFPIKRIYLKKLLDLQIKLSRVPSKFIDTFNRLSVASLLVYGSDQDLTVAHYERIHNFIIKSRTLQLEDLRKKTKRRHSDFVRSVNSKLKALYITHIAHLNFKYKQRFEMVLSVDDIRDKLQSFKAGVFVSTKELSKPIEAVANRDLIQALFFTRFEPIHTKPKMNKIIKLISELRTFIPGKYTLPENITFTAHKKQISWLKAVRKRFTGLKQQNNIKKSLQSQHIQRLDKLHQVLK